MSEEIRKNAEINDDELEQVSGGVAPAEMKQQCDFPERHLCDAALEVCPICGARNPKFVIPLSVIPIDMEDSL